MDNSLANLVLFERNMGSFMLTNGFFDELELGKSKEESIFLTSTVVSVDDFFDLPIYKKNKDINNMMIDKLSGKNADNNEPPCPRCGGERIFLRRQTRASDEMANNELHCLSCNLVQLC